MPLSLYKQVVDIQQQKENIRHVAESSASYRVLTERHLQAVWLEQKYFKSLCTTEGKTIEILSPGIWNAEAGPDFLKAHLRINDREYRGDIELHLSDEGWYNHHHHTDPLYDNVILHISLWEPIKQRPLFNTKNIAIERTYLQHHLTISQARIFTLIDLDLYPYQKFVGSGQCAKQLFHKLSKEKLFSFFESAAIWRLEQKHRHLQEKTSLSHSPFAAGLAMVLGYKHNADNFLEIFLRLQQLDSKDESILFTHALGYTGFFSDHYQKKWKNSSLYQQLFHIYQEAQNQLLPPICLRLDSIRPANNPIRRLALLVKIILDPSLVEKWKEMNRLWKQWWPTKPSNKKWKELFRCLLDLFPDYQDDYWLYHYNFEETPQNKAIALLGDETKKEAFINIYLPLLYHEIESRKDPNELIALVDFYRHLPASKTKKGQYLIQRFFGDSEKGELLHCASTQQGAYQLHRDFCLHYEASCIGCPFVDRYRSVAFD